MWEFVDKVVYINLNERTDRNTHMVKMTKAFGDKVIRFPAIRHSPGNIGCTKSHIAILKMAIESDWNNVLILEDDSDWNEYYLGYSKLSKIVQSHYDVILLGGTAVSYYPDTFRLASAQTTSAYLVNRHYMPTLLENFEEGLANLIKSQNGHVHAIDMYWKQLQSRDTWYIVFPSLVYQIPGYSDIENTRVDYTAAFGVDKQAQMTLPYQKMFRK